MHAQPGIAATSPILRDVPEVLRSARLTIRVPRPGDGTAMFAAVAESIAELRAFPASLPWAMVDPSAEGAEQYCREAYANFVARRDLPFMILRRGTRTVLGSIGLHRMDWNVPRFELGYWGRASTHGHGYVTEAAATLVTMAFETLGARRVEALVDDANERSCRMCERIGFTLEGVLRNERVEAGGVLRNTRVYAKVR